MEKNEKGTTNSFKNIITSSQITIRLGDLDVLQTSTTYIKYVEEGDIKLLLLLLLRLLSSDNEELSGTIILFMLMQRQTVKHIAHIIEQVLCYLQL